MKPPRFDYVAPRSLAEAVAALADGEGKVLAGGQSLLPLLNMRLAAPRRLVDINRLPGLAGIAVGADTVEVGALARHAAVAADPAAAAALPLLGQALHLVAHPVIRNRGTVCGSIVHADPSGEMTAVLPLLGGTVHAVGPAGRREIPAADFFVAPLQTTLAAEEVVTAVSFPRLPPGSGTSFVEVARRHGDYAVAGVAAAVSVARDGRILAARVAGVSLSDTPRSVAMDAVLAGQPVAAAEWAAAASRFAAGTEPASDIHASADYRRHLARVLAERALRAAGERALRAVAEPDAGRDAGSDGAA